MRPPSADSIRDRGKSLIAKSGSMAAILTFSPSLSDRLTNRGRPSMGLGADAPSACARHRARRWSCGRWRTLGPLPSRASSSRCACSRGCSAVVSSKHSQQAHRGGRLQFFGEYAALGDARAFAAWLAPLREVEWVVYAKRPFAGPAAVLAYLSRYTHRVAISNSRLLAFDERGVTFRWKDYRATGKTRYKAMTLSADEFMRRFLLHVLPSGFHRIRHYGLLANAGRREHLAQARELLHVPIATAAPPPLARRRQPPADLRLSALRRRDDHRRHLRSRGNHSRTADIASRRMSTRLHRHYVRFSSATADSGRLCLTRPEPDFSASASSPNPASDRRHHASTRCQPPIQRPIDAIAPTCDPSNPHSRLASPNGIGACRGFLPRGLCDACPRGVIASSHVCASGQASHNP